MAPVLAENHQFLSAARSDEMRCFHMLGFDVILDRDFYPYLLEINNSPSLNIDEVFPLDKDDDAKPCLCMELSGPHRHQISLVDLHVKQVALGGAFRLLEQLSEGAEEPEDDAFIRVNVDVQLYAAISGIQALFRASGGAEKAFTGSAMRRHLAALAGHGRLEKHDFDALSRRLRGVGTGFVARDEAQALRLFDYINMLEQLSSQAFPELEHREAFRQVCELLGL